MFKIIESEVIRNKRFMLGSITRLMYQPVSPYQVITGKNGSGKSTLLQLLTAYDPEAGDYHKNGLLRTKIQTAEESFEVVCDINNGVKYQFLTEEGDNLNTGGTRVVQRELYAKHLGMTDDIYDILTNKVRLTRLSPQKRQEIFSRVAGTDMTFAYRVYNDLKRNLRDVTGAKRVLEETLVKRQAQDLSDEEYAVLEKRMEEYQQTATELLQEYRSDIDQRPADNIDQTLLQLDRFISDLDRDFNARWFGTPISAKSKADFQRLLQEDEQRLSNLQVEGRQQQERYDDLSSMLKRLTDSSSDNLEQLNEERQRLEKHLAHLQNAEYYATLHYENPVRAQQALKAILPDLQLAFQTLPLNEDKQFGAKALADTQSRIQNGRQQLNAVNMEKSRVEARIEHLQTEHSTSCPKCGFNSTAEKRDVEVARLQEQQQALNTKVANYETALRKLEADALQIQDYIDQYKNIMSYERSNPVLKPFFTELFQRGSIFTPGSLVGPSGLLYADLEKYAQQEEVTTRLNEVNRILEGLRRNDITGTQELHQRLGELSKAVEHNTYHQVDLAESLRRRKGLMRSADLYETFIDQSVNTHNRLEQELELGTQALFNNIRRVIIEDLQGHIGNLSKELNDARSNRESIRDLERQLADLTQDISGYTLAIAKMSPASGLIANHMFGAINDFIAEMNAVIARVWSYPMSILPCKLGEDAQLNYLFPVEVAYADTLVKDIAMTSDGQLEIIDFAFKIVALMQLGAQGIPLLMDETDRPMEPIHKAKLMNYVKELIETGHFSQVFIVSHHEGAYGALPFPDIIEVTPMTSHPDYNKVMEVA